MVTLTEASAQEKNDLERKYITSDIESSPLGETDSIVFAECWLGMSASSERSKETV